MFGTNLDTLLLQLSIIAIPGIFAITTHEVAHGWVARRLGDPTAYMLGRLTLNPIKHIDPIGTVVVPIALMLTNSGFLFGWAKPVPVAFRNLKHPRRDMMFVAAAGPGVNFLMAIGWAVLLAVAIRGFDADLRGWPVSVCFFGMQFNILLALFNLIPIPPLDGGRVLTGLVPRNVANLLDRVEPFGFIIVIVLLVVPGSPLGQLLAPFMGFFTRLFSKAVGLA